MASIYLPGDVMAFPVRKKTPTLGVATPHMTDRSVAHESGEKEYVTEAQRLLSGQGRWADFNPGKIDGNYGAATGHAARRAAYWLGYPRKRVNSAYGQQLRAYLLPRTHEQSAKLPRRFQLTRAARRARKAPPEWFRRTNHGLGQKMFDIAKTQVGTKESPANSNRVKYSVWYGFSGPWCAMFLSWCAAQAGSKQAARMTRWAAVSAVVFDARAGRNGLKVVSFNEVKRGDWCAFHFTESFQHIGMFDHWVTKGSTFATIEGNTSADAAGSQSNGGIVARKTREVGNLHNFVRLSS